MNCIFTSIGGIKNVLVQIDKIKKKSFSFGINLTKIHILIEAKYTIE